MANQKKWGESGRGEVAAYHLKIAYRHFRIATLRMHVKGLGTQELGGSN